MATKHQQQTKIKLVSECFIKPKHEIIDATKQFYHLGPVDLIFLTIDPIQKGLLYTLNNNTTSTCSSSSSSNHDIIEPIARTKVVSRLLEKLKHSLSIALVHFYPLAGRFAVQTYPDEDACSVYIDCNKGPGARFIHATALDVTVSDILSPVDVTIAHPLFDLGERYVNYDCHTKALLSIQVTELQDGVFIGFSMSHSVVDGTSFIHFVSMLSEIFRSNGSSNVNTPISRPPIFNYRPWLSNEGDPTILKLPFSDVEKFICHGYDPSPLRERIFHFSPTSMASLKVKANQECGTDNVISSFQALSALVWRSITRARAIPLDQQAKWSITIGARNRVDPPISDDYIGNFVSKTQYVCQVEELLNNKLGWVANNLRKVIMTQDGKAIISRYKKFAKSPFIAPIGLETHPHGTNSVIIGGSPRFNIYEPEFGLGRAIVTRMGYANKSDGKITANLGCEGKGSVDLEICLRPHVMAILENDEEFMNFAL